MPWCLHSINHNLAISWIVSNEEVCFRKKARGVVCSSSFTYMSLCMLVPCFLKGVFFLVLWQATVGFCVSEMWMSKDKRLYLCTIHWCSTTGSFHPCKLVIQWYYMNGYWHTWWWIGLLVLTRSWFSQRSMVCAKVLTWRYMTPTNRHGLWTLDSLHSSGGTIWASHHKWELAVITSSTLWHGKGYVGQTLWV